VPNPQRAALVHAAIERIPISTRNLLTVAGALLPPPALFVPLAVFVWAGFAVVYLVVFLGVFRVWSLNAARPQIRAVINGLAVQDAV
jgi:hypothetical protein